MNLFLTPSFKDVASIFMEFEKPVPGKRVTFIPTASLVEDVNFFVDDGKAALSSLGLIVDELEISSATSEEIAEKLRANDYIYVTGGNTFFLLQEIKKKGADKIIQEQVKSGKLYIGESAGAILATANIDYSQAMDVPQKAPELQNYDALNLVDFYVVPHFGCFPFEEETKKIVDTYSAKLNLIKIMNDEAILVKNDKVKVEKANKES